ncbi:MAG: hypothetical protein DI541_20285, partial [Aeromonas media]
FGCGLFCLATNQIAQTGLSSLPPVIYYSEQLFKMVGLKKDIVINNSLQFVYRAGFLRTGWHISWQHQVPGMSPPFPA